MTERTIVHGARQLVRIDGDGLEVVEDGAVVVEDGTVAAVGPTAEVTRSHPTDAADTVVDASGKTVLPGYVDPHTHAVFAGDRVDEFAAKLRGKSYQEIQAEGGGILSTVRAVREAFAQSLPISRSASIETSSRLDRGIGLRTRIRPLVDRSCRTILAAADETVPSLRSGGSDRDRRAGPRRR